MADLITPERAILNGTLKTLSESNPDALAALISSASTTIIRYCHVDFTSTSYSEYYDGGGTPYQRLALRQFPVLSISRVATSPQTVLVIQNTNTSLNQRATVQTTATGLTLTRVASGVTSIDTLTYASNVTLGALAAAVIALGNGWTATVQVGYTLFPSADLRVIQGALDARNNVANLELFEENLMPWASAGLGASPYAGVWSSDPGWRLNAATGELWGTFPNGIQNIWVEYTAGYAAIPDDVQEACVMAAQDIYQNELANRALRGEVLGPTAKQYASDTLGLSKMVIDLIGTYVAWDKASGLA